MADTIRRTQSPAKPTGKTPTLAERIAAARDAARASSGGDNSYYSAEARERLWTECTVLILHGAIRTTGKFGDKWELSVSENGPETSRGIISLSANAYRDTYFESLAEIIETEGAIGPFMLTKRATKSGQSSWDFVEWSDDVDGISR